MEITDGILGMIAMPTGILDYVDTVVSNYL